MKKLGLVLGGGGAKGLAHIGVLKVLVKNKIRIDFIAGTSMGAIIGAYYALNLNLDGAERFSLSFTKKDTLGLIDLNNPKISLVKGEKVKKILKNFFAGKTFNDTKIPLRIVATCIDTGMPYIFDSGLIMDALMASSAVPGVFPVFETSGMGLVDGGLSEPVGIDALKEIGAQAIIAVSLFGFKENRLKDYSMSEVMAQTYQIIASRFFSYRKSSHNVIVLQPEIKAHVYDFFKAEEIIREG